MPPPSKLIEEQWERFREHCLPLDCPAEQLNDIRFSFFAGAIALFWLMGQGPATKESADRQVRLVDEELARFKKEIEAFYTLNRMEKPRWLQ